MPLILPTLQVLFNSLLLDFIPACLFLPWKQSVHLVICLQLSHIIDMSNKYGDQFPYPTYALYFFLDLLMYMFFTTCIVLGILNFIASNKP